MGTCTQIRSCHPHLGTHLGGQPGTLYILTYIHKQVQTNEQNQDNHDDMVVIEFKYRANHLNMTDYTDFSIFLRAVKIEIYLGAATGNIVIYEYLGTYGAILT